MSCVCFSDYSENKLNKGDVDLTLAVNAVETALRKELRKTGLQKDWCIEYSPTITLEEMYDYRKVRQELLGLDFSSFEDVTYLDNYMKPDGGVIWLKHKFKPLQFPLLVSEMKYQGTNKGRLSKGQDKQALGNANERLGKYCMAFRTLFEFDDILPFVTFNSGCDYQFDSKGIPLNGGAKTQGAKLISLNGGFSKFNVVYTSKNLPNCRRMLPSTIMVKEEFWSVPEMVTVLKEVALDSYKYFKSIIKRI